ncbi:hypothetical protein E4656_07285 [Natronospirillum operosum]|uniref:Tetratricopeptide repeat protein n=1 Tax=Natronospirillum operosum TaxID=2759953 RepID=A0A4Z0WFA7_9GAMM|nr:hypothetical protein [Natronospirillum operosum]TGG93976.1 hypothetical protein E4656_07285 [Natronospirillum operosum]
MLAAGHYSAALQAYSRARCLCQQRLSAGEDVPQWLPAYGATIANLAHCWAMIGLRTQAMAALNEALETLYHYDDRVAGATAQQVQYRLLTQWLQLERCRLHPIG